jgi:hypothetical protein
VFSDRGRRAGHLAPLRRDSTGQYDSKNYCNKDVVLPSIGRRCKSCASDTNLGIGFASRESDARSLDG